MKGNQTSTNEKDLKILFKRMVYHNSCIPGNILFFLWTPQETRGFVQNAYRITYVMFFYPQSAKIGLYGMLKKLTYGLLDFLFPPYIMGVALQNLLVFSAFLLQHIYMHFERMRVRIYSMFMDIKNPHEAKRIHFPFASV